MENRKVNWKAQVIRESILSMELKKHNWLELKTVFHRRCGIQKIKLFWTKASSAEARCTLFGESKRLLCVACAINFNEFIDISLKENRRKYRRKSEEDESFRSNQFAFPTSKQLLSWELILKRNGILIHKIQHQVNAPACFPTSQ